MFLDSVKYFGYIGILRFISTRLGIQALLKIIVRKIALQGSETVKSETKLGTGSGNNSPFLFEILLRFLIRGNLSVLYAHTPY